MLLPLIVISAAVVAWRFDVARKTAREIFDRNLVMLCLAVSRDVAFSGGDSLSQTTLNLFRDAAGGEIFYHVYGPDGSFVTGYSSPPIVPKSDKNALNTPTLFTSTHLGQPIRAARLAEYVNIDGVAGTSVVTVWQSTQPRMDFATRMTIQSAIVMALLLLSVAGLLFFGIRFGLRPLTDLEDAILKRSHNDLRPIARPVPIEAKGLVSRLNSLFSSLTEANSAKDRLISNAAHQLRNPIAAVHSLATATLHAPDFEQTKERATLLVSETNRTVRITEQMLSIERLSALSARLTQEDIIPILTEHARYLAGKTLGKNKEFYFHCDVPKALVMFDSVLLQEAFTNLVDNALSHGGDRLTQISITVAALERGLRISVSNDGAPIDPTQKEWIFERFAQETESQGAGLGLSIVREIMKRHQGQVRLAHTDPVTFELTLPIV